MATAPALVTPVTGGARRLELADIVRAHGDDYRARHVLSSEQLQALSAIEGCRTAALGGHLEVCERCGFTRVVYNSCGNRHCPKCQVLAKQRWLERRQADLLAIPYFHVIFTLPHELNPLARRHPRQLYGLLFRCAADTLQDFARRHLGGDLGITAVLHTWSQVLQLHPHVHCLVTGGALSPEGAWTPARCSYLFPVKALSTVFCGKLLEALQEHPELGDSFRELSCKDRRQLRRKRWVVYCQAPFAGPETVLSYLARYTHRVALSNDRLLEFRQGLVSFSWRDRTTGCQRVLQLSWEEFLRRVLQHVLPHRFMRIRHYGLHASRRRQDLVHCRSLLGMPETETETESEPDQTVAQVVLRLTGRDLELCPACRQGRMREGRRLQPGERLILPSPQPFDTS